MKLPTPVGLVGEKGVIGEILRQLPRTTLNEAETKGDPWSWLAKWVEKNPVECCCEGTVEKRDAECAVLEKKGFKRTGIGVYSTTTPTSYQGCQGVREVRFNYYKPDPRKIIMRLFTNKRWPDSFRKTFEAAASQKHALRRLGEIAAGGGSNSQSPHDALNSALKRNNLKAANRRVKNMATLILQYDKQWFNTAPPEIRMIVSEIEKTSYDTDKRQLGRKKADKKWKDLEKARTPLEFMRNDKGQKVGTELTLRWLSVGDDGFPGYCFIADKILATMLGLTLPFRGLLPTGDDAENERGRKFIEDCRRDIGLKKAETIVNALKPVNEFEWAIFDKNDNEVGRFKRANSVPKK